MKPPKGPFAVVLSILASPWTAWALLVWIGFGALLGLAAWPGVHPAEGLALQLPAALLPWCLLARALAEESRQLWISAVAGGLALAFAGSALVGGEAGWTRLGAQEVTQQYLRESGRRPVPVHLGGQLTATPTDDGLALRLGVPELEKASTVVPLDGREAPLGPWAVHHHALEAGSEPTVARIRLRPRDGEGAPIERTLRVNDAVVTPDGVQVFLRRLSPDFGRALGPAAQITVTTDDASETAWHFVADPALDARAGALPWTLELLEVSAEPVWVLGVRRRGGGTVALSGWALVVLGLLAGFPAERRA